MSLPFAACTLALALALGACRQTVLFELEADAGGGRGGGAGASGGGVGGKGGLGGLGGFFPPPPDGGFCEGGQSRILVSPPELPDIIVALDRSVSMNGPFGLSTKLEEARQALTLASNHYAAIRFGYVGFPGASFGCANSACCPTEVLPPDPESKAFQQALSTCDVPGLGPPCPVGSQRPTAAALQASANLFSRVDQEVRGRYVLLVTDGDPGCGDNVMSACRDAQLQVSTLALLDRSVKTIVVGVGPPSNDLCLRTVLGASAYYPVTPDSLSSRIDEIAHDIAKNNACRLNVQSQFPDPSRIVLLHDGFEVPRDGPGGGWEFDPPGSRKITVRGIACELLITEGRDRFDVAECLPPRP